MNTRKWVASLIAGAALFTAPALASATSLTIGDAYYMGSVDPGTPSSPASEAGYINQLADLAPGTSTTIGGYAYDRSSNTLCYNTCTDATTVGSVSDNSGGNTGSLGSGYLYLLAKYGNTDYVWYIAGLTGSFTIPSTIGTGGGLSHWALFDPNGSSVPEPASLMLFGTGLATLAYRLKSRARQQA